MKKSSDDKTKYAPLMDKNYKHRASLAKIKVLDATKHTVFKLPKQK